MRGKFISPVAGGIVLGLVVHAGIFSFVWTAPAYARETVRVWVRALAASDIARGGVNPRVGDIQGQLDTLFRYKSYAVIAEVNEVAPVGQPVHMNLRDGGRLTLVPLGVERGMIQMNMRIMEGQRVMFNTRVHLANRGTLLIGGPKHREGVIIFAISASLR